MKFIICGPGGVLENVMALTGYDNLCYMIADDEELVFEIFEKVGSRLVEYYERIVDFDCVGAIISNDDWGFNTQTMLSTNDMRKYVFPWHKKIVNLAKKANKPTILHSCGNLINVYDDIIDDMGFSGKHSYEDNILPVEKAYELLKGRIAVLGGIDLDFVCRKTPKEVYECACKLLEQTNGIGYGLGSGNSIPYYTPNENYLAMISAALFN
jgi:uroporphyrinogen decarboxylase